MVTYLDSGVLLAAWRNAELRPAALQVLEDERRQFVTSQLTKLELLPKPVFEKRPVERAFYHRPTLMRRSPCSPWMNN